MTKTELKKAIASMYGFAQNKITLLEYGEQYGELDYVMFEVCGIEYQSTLNDDGEFDFRICEFA